MLDLRSNKTVAGFLTSTTLGIIPRSSVTSTRSNSSGSASASLTHSIRSSEDDITLNEMMGKFDESYVYEKETDILSDDSDQTDCDEYVRCCISDFDTGREGGDENDPFDNDFDFIDKGSLLDIDHLEDANFPPTNTGHCTYFTLTNELTRRRSTKIGESYLRASRRLKASTAAPAPPPTPFNDNPTHR